MAGSTATAGAAPLWRSMLFIPVLNERFVARAGERGADAIQLDLEDSIPPDRKAEARAAVAETAARVAGAGRDVLVRVNRPWSLLVRDLEASVCRAVAAINLPKVDSAEHLLAAVEVIEEAERRQGLPPGHTKILAMIETAKGLENAGEIARAHPRLVAMTAGAEDLAVSFGGRPTEDLLYYSNLRVLSAARAAGVMPIGYFASVADYADLGRFRQVAERSAALGFEGGFCIHPSQVGPLNEAFSPAPAEVEKAAAMVAAYEAAKREGCGAIVHEGRMLDQPIVDQAMRLLQRQSAVATRTGGSGAL
ncbi:citrate lyase subunit beta / citryl-CoA lyase [Tistlia consotensis]|uniref:Citrate lyase subunit beta / citryl-CoA lyase n=1 Tax=Tistlia consotensis USBA 355 TaxID=560819 RepID=A0A1Y6BUW8_9PROT|nr:CoA ester lyase [Tistlia consotensis]SMF29188.1 citrate lyase subunit beta / citryl-CoA lyase [Tistlia consotensis USBA 355]SNR91535.1 citrate lyase subunit beta / citryl-CoA lyase [Tistlia consotensis]